MDETTKRVRQVWQELASTYDRWIRIAEKVLFGDGRQWVCGQAGGEVLDVAVGTGRNVPLYSPHVQLTGIDLSPAMLARARDLTAKRGRRIALLEGDAQALPFPDASFDPVVCTLSLCSIPDDRGRRRNVPGLTPRGPTTPARPRPKPLPARPGDTAVAGPHSWTPTR